MGYLAITDRSKRIGDQVGCSFSDETLELFPDLRLNPREKDWLNWTPIELDKENICNNYAVTTFRNKVQCWPVADSLLNGDPKPVRAGIERLCVHVSGGILDKYVFRQFHKIRANPILQKRVGAVVDELIEGAFEESRYYVGTRKPEVLDHHFRNLQLFAVTVPRLNPSLTLTFFEDLSRTLRPFRNEFSTHLLLASLRPQGYAANEISEWDLEYLRLWLCGAGSPEGEARGADNAAYNASPKDGWKLLQMHGRDAKVFLRRKRLSIRRSLVREMYRKCVTDPSSNTAWLAARFLKLHLSLHAVEGRNAYHKLPQDLMAKVFVVATHVGRTLRPNTVKLPYKDHVLHIVNSVEAYLKQEPSGKTPR